MKIAIDIRSMSGPTPSGVGHSVFELLRALTELPHDHDILLFTTGRKPYVLPTELAQDKRMRLIQPRGPSRLWNLGIAFGIVRLRHLLGEEPDVVWYPNTGFLPKTTARVILTVHDLAFHLMPSTYTHIDHLRYRITRARTWIRRADQIIAISQATRSDLIQALQISKERISVIPHGIDTEQFHPRTQPTDATKRQRLGVRTPYILSLATREPRKNLQTLIEAWERARDAGFTSDLVLAGGPGWKRKQLDRHIATSPHREHLHVLGYVSDTVRPALLRGAQALALPSRYEGFGRQILEAMACGTPVITSRNRSLLEVAGPAALSAHAMNVSEWTNLLLELNPVLEAELKKSVLKQTELSSWKRAARALLSTLDAEA